MNKNRIILVLLSTVVFAGIFVFIYNNFYLKKKIILGERTEVYNKYNNVKKQVNDFDNIRDKMKDQEYTLEEIFSIYDGYYKTNDEIINSYTNMIKEFLAQHEITVTDTTIQELSTGNDLVLLLSFKKSYDELYQLLFDIERFSTVSELKISYLGDVSFKCSPNLYSQEIDDYFAGRRKMTMSETEASGYFKEISDKVFSEMNIGEYSTWKDLFPVPRNPLFPGYVKKKAVAVKGNQKPKKVFKPLPGGIVLQGVMYESNVPIAIIDGKLFKEGSVHKDVRIVKINKNNVDVEYYGNMFKLKMAN